jgi:hypothetical protein
LELQILPDTGKTYRNRNVNEPAPGPERAIAGQNNRLQQKKRALIDATIGSEQPLMEGLSFADIEEMRL